jgi:hypothetical protein
VLNYYVFLELKILRSCTSMYRLKRVQTTGTSSISSFKEPDNLAILNKLFSRSYFAQLWIIQEFLLAQSITLYCGQLSLNISNELISELYTQGVKVPPRVRFINKTKPESSRAPIDLRELLPTIGICGMTDPRDKIFGLLELIDNT